MRPSEQIQKLIAESLRPGDLDAALEFVKAYEAKVDEVVAELRRMESAAAEQDVIEFSGEAAFYSGRASGLKDAVALVAQKLGAK